MHCGHESISYRNSQHEWVSAGGLVPLPFMLIISKLLVESSSISVSFGRQISIGVSVQACAAAYSVGDLKTLGSELVRRHGHRSFTRGRRCSGVILVMHEGVIIQERTWHGTGTHHHEAFDLSTTYSSFSCRCSFGCPPPSRPRRRSSSIS